MRTCFVTIALKDQQFANFGKREPQLLSVPDESNASDVLRREQTKAAFGSRWPFQQLLSFIKPDGVDAYAGLFGYAPNLNPTPSHMLQPTIWSRL
jgi:hypothetical protein